MTWFRSAAESGHASAHAGDEYNLAIIYAMGMKAMGLGLPRNKVLAHLWFDLAARKSAAEVSPARRLAREWLAKHPGE